MALQPFFLKESDQARFLHSNTFISTLTSGELALNGQNFSGGFIPQWDAPELGQEQLQQFSVIPEVPSSFGFGGLSFVHALGGGAEGPRPGLRALGR